MNQKLNYGSTTGSPGYRKALRLRKSLEKKSLQLSSTGKTQIAQTPRSKKFGIHKFWALRTLCEGDIVTRAINDSLSELMSHHDTLLSAAKKTLAFIHDLSDSNPGFMGKLTLQDYAQWNEAMMELPRAIANAEAHSVPSGNEKV